MKKQYHDMLLKAGYKPFCWYVFKEDEKNVTFANCQCGESMQFTLKLL